MLSSEAKKLVCGTSSLKSFRLAELMASTTSGPRGAT